MSTITLNHILSILKRTALLAVLLLSTLPRPALEDNLYCQHFGGIETTHGDSEDILMKSLIVVGDLKSFSMLFRLLPMNASINHRVKISFYDNWKSRSEGSALVMLHSGYKEKGEVRNRFHKVHITPSDEWQYYELDTFFCPGCPERIFNSLKIIRPDRDTLLADELMVIDLDAGDTLFYDGFEHFDSAYRQFREYQCYMLTENIAPAPATDCAKGKHALQLAGNDHLSLYPQTRLDSFVQVQLGSGYWLQFPRFLNKNEAYDFSEAIAEYNNAGRDNVDPRAVYLADIVKLWAVAENAYPYPEIRTGIGAEALLDRCIGRALQPDYDVTAHFRNIVYLHSAYRDPHLNPYWKGKTPKKPPVIPQLIDGAYRIGLVYDERYTAFFGREITHIDGQEIDSWLSERLYNKDSINSAHLLNNCLRYLCYSFGTGDTIRFSLKGGPELVCPPADWTATSKAVRKPFSYLKDTIQTVAGGKAVYIRISPFSRWDRRDEERSAFVRDSLPRYPWVILDFRDTHINYTSQRVLEYKKRAHHLRPMPDHNAIIDEPFLPAFESRPLNLLDAARHEIGFFEFPPRIIALVNENTRSAPERHLLPLYDAGLITVIGQPAAGTASFANKLQLPSGIKLSFTMGRTTYEDGTPYQDNGLQPHHPVRSVLSKRDLFLEKAMEIITREP